MAKRRGRKKSTSAAANKDHPEKVASDGMKANASSVAEDDKPTCPLCSRVFTSAHGLKYHVDKKVCQNSPTKKAAAKKKAGSSSKKSAKESESEEDEALDEIPKKSPPKANSKRSIKRQREESSESESEYDLSDTQESDDDFEEPKAKKSRLSTSSKNDAGFPEPDEDGMFTCPSCDKTFKSKLGIKGHIENKICLEPAQKKEKGPKSKVCPQCQKSFNSKGGWKYHMENSVCSIERRGSVCNRPILPDKESDDEVEVVGVKNPKRRRASASRKSYKEEQDSDNDDKSWSGKSAEDESSDDASVASAEVKTSTPTKKKRRNLTNDQNETSDGKHECPTCYRVFTSGYGLKYHLNKKVCQSVSATKRKSKLDDAEEVSMPSDQYRQIKPGSMYITKFGIVKVISDNRLPPGHHKTKIKPRKVAVERFERNKRSYASKQNEVAEIMYSGGRRRRERLQKMQELDGSLLGSSVWSMYCGSVNRQQILSDKLSWKDFNGDINKGFEVDSFDQQDPRHPKDWYHDRIVECELVGDERNCIPSSTSSSRGGDTDKSSPNVATPKIRLFLARNELSERYDKNDTVYLCSTCGVSFYSEDKWETHTKSKACSTAMQAKQGERMMKLEAREENLIDSEADNAKFLSSMHAVMKPKVGRVQFGNPCNIKQHKKHKMPSWIVFNDQHTSMYPELFIALKFKRGSQNRNWAGKKKTAEDYVHGNDRKRERKAKSRMNQTLKYELKSSMEQTAAQQESVKRTTKRVTVDMIHKFALEQAARQEEAKKQGKYITASDQIHEFALKQAAKQERTNAEINASELPPLLPTASSIPPALPSIEMTDLFGENVFAESSEMIDSSITHTNAEPKEQIPVPPQTQTTAAAAPPSTTKPKKKRARKKKVDTGSKEKNSKSTFSEVSPPSGSGGSHLTASIDNRPSNAAAANTGSTDSEANEGVKVYFKGKKNPVVIDTHILINECDSGRYPTITRFEGDHLTECVLCTRKGADDEDPLIDCDFCQNTAHQICLNKKMLNKDPPIIIREQEPHDSLMCHDCMMYCIARRARAESRRTAKWHYELSRVGLSHPDAANLAEEVDLTKGTSDDIDDNAPTYAKCPNGGPGGLICCAHCTAAYSRILSNTAKEMECQSVAKAGQEMNEILDLLADAKQRLLNATDVSQANEVRRRLLKNNEV